MSAKPSRIRVNDIDVAYSLEGPEGAPVLTFSHSLCADHRMWDAQIPAFTKRFRVLRLDTRGHGATSAPAGPYSFDMLAGDVVGLLDALGIARTHFVGLSLGGMVGQNLALRYPDRVDRLVLCATAASTPQPESWDTRIKIAETKGLAGLADATLGRWFSDGFRAAAPEVVARIGQAIRATPLAGFVGCGQAIRALNNLPRLPAIRARTLILIGDDDIGTPVPISEEMHRLIPGSALVVFPWARHLINIEVAEGFNRAVLGFLEQA
jgi:3-oxoadipate enol-lactonase